MNVLKSLAPLQVGRYPFVLWIAILLDDI